MQYFDVYIDGMKDLYTYSDKNHEFLLGETVLVPFRNIKKTAIIIKNNNLDKYDFKILNIESKVKDSIKLSSYQLDLIEWMANYYLASYDSIIKAMFPKNIKLKSKQYYFLDLERFNIENKLDCKLKENEIIDYLISLSEISYTTAKSKFKKRVVDSLIDKSFFELEENTLKINIDNFLLLKDENIEIYTYFYKKLLLKKETLEKNFSREKIKQLKDMEILSLEIEFNEKKDYLKEDLRQVYKKESVLTEEQISIKNEIEQSDYKYFLLKGVTGSGKTEIYIDLVKEAFFRGEGSIFLVPEISLTPQMINKFKNEFKNNIAILHSRLTDKERAKEWESIYTGEKKIVLGARSAIFSPVQNLKYIILDEEHETTYKQDNNPRYHAKYVAIKRCLLENAKLILGSATPSIESYYYAKKGIYKLLNLDKRYGLAKIPNVEIIDMKKEEDLFFSKKLLQEIKETLIKGEQVILLLNRKGYSTYIQCKDCGHVEECEHCSIKMSYFSGSRKYKCNYCGKTKKYTGKCLNCGSENLIHSGKGIERVEEELKKYFDVPIIKADGDYSKNKDFFSKLYADFLNKKYSILIGTQIIAKGLHFPDVTLVGVINSDIILNFPDFRAGEKTFQLLTQVSGRAGRGEKTGKVIIQTYEKENYAIENSKEEYYEKFYEKEIKMREVFLYPPFSKLINIGLSSENENDLVSEASKVFELLKNDIIEMYGPMPSMVYKVKNRYRMNIFIKGSKQNIDKFKKYLSKKLKELKNNNIRITVDIDPINLM